MATNDPDLLSRLLQARSTAQVEAIMAGLPVVSPEDYQWLSADERSGPWQSGKLHWFRSAATVVTEDELNLQVSL